MFNAIVENKDNFVAKWREMLDSENALVRYKARQFIEMILEARPIEKFDIDLYFTIMEKHRSLW